MQLRQLSAQSGGHALEAAFARVSRLPLPIVSVPSIQMAGGDDEYTDNYHDAYSDDPYVDAPYDDYQDNQPDDNE
jgi:hypothetical protein